MKLRLRFLAFALGTGLAFAAPTAAQAQVSVGVNVGLPPWGPAAPQGTQYYYIPEIDGYYDIYNGVYLVFDGAQWITQPYLDGYDPYYFHPVPVSYRGAQPWLYIGSYRNRYPQYVTVYRGGGYGNSGRYYGQEYGAGRVYGYDHSGYGYGNRGGGYGYGNRSSYNNQGYNRAGYGGQSNYGGSPRVEPGRGDDHDGRGNFGGNQPGRGGFNGGNFGGNQPSRGGFNGGSPGGQPAPGRGGNFGGSQPRSEGQRGGGDHGGGGGDRGRR